MSASGRSLAVRVVDYTTTNQPSKEELAMAMAMIVEDEAVQSLDESESLV